MNLFFVALVLVAIRQPSRASRGIAVIYATGQALFAMADPYLGDYAYYAGAGIIDAAVVCAIACHAYSNFGFSLQLLSAFNFMVNFYGLLTYHPEVEPTTYNVTLWAVLVAATFVLVTGGPDAWGKSKVYRLLVDFFGAHHADSTRGYSLSREARN